MTSSQQTETPYLSAVIGSRNDDHGGDMYGRMRSCFLGFIAQAERHKLSSELIIVDWNPPTDRPLLKDAFPWPERTDYCTVRSIVVPASIHHSYPYADRQHLIPTEAMNVGIRRSRGEFLLAINADILLSDELFGFLAKKQLDPNRLYRVDRCDVDRRVTELQSLEEQLLFCSHNVINVYTEHGTIPVRPGTTRLPHSRPGVVSYVPSNGSKRPSLHTNAGDFILMSRDRFHALRGWPSLNVVGAGAEALLSITAAISGLAQEILPPRLQMYHIDHDATWAPQQPIYRFYRRAARSLFRQDSRLRNVIFGFYWWLHRNDQPRTAAGVPYMSHYRFNKLTEDLWKGRRGVEFNDENWGLRGEQLQEFIIVSPSSRIGRNS